MNVLEISMTTHRPDDVTAHARYMIFEIMGILVM